MKIIRCGSGKSLLRRNGHYEIYFVEVQDLNSNLYTQKSEQFPIRVNFINAMINQWQIKSTGSDADIQMYLSITDYSTF